jgi:hypothetical protein
MILVSREGRWHVHVPASLADLRVLLRGDGGFGFDVAFGERGFDGEGFAGVDGPVFFLGGPVGEGVLFEGDLFVLGFAGFEGDFGEGF